MSDLPASLRFKIGQLLRLLGSDQDGEVIATSRALGRLLASAGLDLHDLAAEIERAVDEEERPWAAYVRDLGDQAEDLSPADQHFLASMSRLIARGATPSPAQAAWLRDLEFKARAAA